MKLKLARTIVVEKYIWRNMIFEEKWHYSKIYVKSRFHCLIVRINFGRIVHRRIYWLIPCLHKHYHRRGMIRRSTLDNHRIVDNISCVRSIFDRLIYKLTHINKYTRLTRFVLRCIILSEVVLFHSLIVCNLHCV